MKVLIDDKSYTVPAKVDADLIISKTRKNKEKENRYVNIKVLYSTTGSDYNNLPFNRQYTFKKHVKYYFKVVVEDIKARVFTTNVPGYDKSLQHKAEAIRSIGDSIEFIPINEYAKEKPNIEVNLTDVTNVLEQLVGMNFHKGMEILSVEVRANPPRNLHKLGCTGSYITLTFGNKYSKALSAVTIYTSTKLESLYLSRLLVKISLILDRLDIQPDSRSKWKNFSEKDIIPRPKDMLTGIENMAVFDTSTGEGFQPGEAVVQLPKGTVCNLCDKIIKQTDKWYYLETNKTFYHNKCSEA